MAVRLDPEEAESRVIHELIDFGGRDVLEIGCGDGRLTWRYAHEAASVLAIDPKESEVAAARESTPDSLKSIVSFQVADITSIELPESAYDLVITSWSL
ncbi:MAG: class I SAM-dependent methyltransferase [Chloroflexi bacterium]|nr:class I SAM-dependent methyltransferase [Chloroflexota bacterium]